MTNIKKKVRIKGLNPKINSKVRIDLDKLKADFQKLDDAHESLYNLIIRGSGQETPIDRNKLIDVNAESMLEKAASGEIGTVKAIIISKVHIVFPDGFECKVSNKSIIKL